MTNGMFVPIVTPMKNGTFDKESYAKLIQTLEPHVQGYVPCLSSGEGHKMNDELWSEVVETTVALTDKPVFAGIKRETMDAVKATMQVAEKLSVQGITLPVVGKSNHEIEQYVTSIASTTNLPIIIYNTETQKITDIETLKRIDQIQNVVAIKDSSMDQQFFDQMLEARNNQELQMAVFQ